MRSINISRTVDETKFNRFHGLVLVCVPLSLSVMGLT